MQYTATYASPLGNILLTADHLGLTGLWFEGGKYSYLAADDARQERAVPVFTDAKRWLDSYFSGKRPGGLPPLHLMGTPFQMEVWELLRAVPYGETTTYGALAARLAARRGLEGMSAQAVGGAVGRNPVSIMIPCHRVVGGDGKLTGYAGGLERKLELLTLEGAALSAPGAHNI